MTIRKQDSKLLMRLVSGQIDEQSKRDLERRLRAEPHLRQALRDFESTWSSLAIEETIEKTTEQAEMPAAETLTPMIMAGVRRQAEAWRREQRGDLDWSAAPLWAKAGSWVSLAAGVMLGVFLALPGASGVARGPQLGDDGATPDAVERPESLFEPLEPTLADAYWQALESSGGRLDTLRERDES